MAEAELDLTQVPAGNQSQRLLSAFDALGAGESVRIIGSGSVRSPPKVFLEARWGAFDWSPAGERQGQWEADLSKRSEPFRGTLAEFLTEDHRRCDALYGAAEAAAQSGDAEKTRSLVQKLRLNMLRHFTMEDRKSVV